MCLHVKRMDAFIVFASSDPFPNVWFVFVAGMNSEEDCPFSTFKFEPGGNSDGVKRPLTFCSKHNKTCSFRLSLTMDDHRWQPGAAGRDCFKLSTEIFGEGFFVFLFRPASFWLCIIFNSWILVCFVVSWFQLQSATFTVLHSAVSKLIVEGTANNDEEEILRFLDNSPSYTACVI